MAADATTPPLEGILVIDLARAVAGPYAAMTLGDLGARVIKVEPPTGDQSRRWGPPFLGNDPANDSTYFLSVNRNKESIVADYKTLDGQHVLAELLARADVLVENFRPGVLGALGFPPERLEQINPRLIVLSISGFGDLGPEQTRPGFDQIVQGEGGLMAVTGDPGGQPTKAGVPIADVLSGMNGAIGVLAALKRRDRTGHGGVVRTSLLASVIGAHVFQATHWTVGKQEPGRVGPHHPSIAPYGMFQAADGHIQIACGTEGQWSAFAAVAGLNASDPRFATNADRVAHHAELVGLINSALEHQPGNYWDQRLRAAGVPAGVIRPISEVYSLDQVRAMGLALTVSDDDYGQLELPGPSVAFDNLRHDQLRAHTAPPRLGADTARVTSWLKNSERTSA
jgi:crotonobetainyl-CoA:carnitine CoA-transferase CaiB-like acyl-CoA transferase